MRILLLIFLVFTLLSCSDKTIQTKDSWEYEIIEINGMTCIKYSLAVSPEGGLTCNWDEWKGGAEEK